MKKAIVTTLMVLAACVATTARATITVNWFAGGGVESPFDGDTTGNDMPAGLYVQLIWSPDGSYSSFDDLDPLSVDSGFVVLDTYTDPNGGAFSTSGTYADGSGTLTGVSEAELLAGSLYIRVYSDSSPTAGDWWGQGPIVGGLLDQDPSPTTPNFVDLTDGDNPYSTWTAIVPEPSVLALAGLGALVVAVRRFRRS